MAIHRSVITHTGSACLTVLAALSLASTAVAKDVQGVSRDEILIGTIQDMSGPVAAFSKEVLGGMQMRIDEANAKGGIHGRKIRLLVEDSGYDTRRGMLAAQKLVSRDRVFLTLGNMGTAIVATTLPVFVDAGVIHAFPTAATPLAFDPPSPFKYSSTLPYRESAPIMLRFLLDKRADRKMCSLAQDDEFGHDLMTGVDKDLERRNLKLLERTTYKRGATEFSSQVARMKAAGCDTVLLATTLRETVGVMTEAEKLSYKPEFMTSAAGFSTLVPKLGGAVTNGLYSIGFNLPPDANGPSAGMKQWFSAYQAKYGVEPGQYSGGGYNGADAIIKGLEGAGPDLNPASFDKAMQAASFPANDLGFAAMTFTDTKRLGSRSMQVYQLQQGKWKPVSDFLEP